MSTNKTIDDLSAGVAVTGTDKIAVWQGAGPTASVTATNLSTFFGIDVVGDTEVAVGTGTALEGTAALTFDGTTLSVDSLAAVTAAGTLVADRVAISAAANRVKDDAGLTFAANVLTLDGEMNGLTGIQLSSTALEESYVALAVDGGASMISNTGSGVSIYATGNIDIGELGVNVIAFDQATAVVTMPGIVVTAPVALAALGSAVTAGAGARAMINDGLTLGTWGSAAADGGVVTKPVWSNGAAWLNG